MRGNLSRIIPYRSHALHRNFARNGEGGREPQHYSRLSPGLDGESKRDSRTPSFFCHVYPHTTRSTVLTPLPRATPAASCSEVAVMSSRFLTIQHGRDVDARTNSPHVGTQGELTIGSSLSVFSSFLRSILDGFCIPRSIR